MKKAIVLGEDVPLIDELQRTTEQQTPTGNVRYYPPDGLDHRTDMLRAVFATIERLEDVKASGESQAWLESVEVL